MVKAHNAIAKRLHDSNIKPSLMILDNEISAELKEAIKQNAMRYQLVPPQDHRRNAAEKAIQIFKDHFVAVLCGTDASFPMQLWCQLLPHAEKQLNLLRKSKVNSNISTFEHLYGKHDYNAHPFAILGTAVEAHVMPSKRKTWASHTLPGFYLGPSWEHYRCHEVWIQETKAKRVGQTVFFKSKHITQPFLTMADALILTGEKLAQALSGAAPHGEATEAAVKQLMEIYKSNTKQEETNVDD